jgi:D-sorbitol dehydrogenase (acceptor)
MNGRLQDRHALLTGAGGGIGLAVAAAYLREGARCTIVDIAASPLAELQTLLSDYTERAQYVATGLARSKSCTTTPHYSTWRRCWRATKRCTTSCLR